MKNEYRAWDPLNKIMYTHSVGVFPLNCKKDLSLSTDGIMIHPEKSHLILMQYIGKKDKNDKKIFEGDLIRYRGKILKVEYFESIYSFQIGLSSSVFDQEISCESDELEIVGNIYQNL